MTDIYCETIPNIWCYLVWNNTKHRSQYLALQLIYGEIRYIGERTVTTIWWQSDADMRQ